MPSIYDLKPKFQQLLSPILQLLIRLKATPNQITCFALILSFLTGASILFFRQNKEIALLVPFVLFVRMALNALDGMLARKQNSSSSLGEILNEVGDILSDAFIYLPICSLLELSLPIIFSIFSFVFLSALSEFSGILAKTTINQRRYDGPMGKSDRAFFIGIYCFLLYLFPDFVANWSVWFFVFGCFLISITCLNRLKPIIQK